MSDAFKNIFPIGLGTGRFPFSSPENYEKDFENSVELVLYALEQGVNYIDVGKGYSKGNAFAVLKEAFRRTDKEYNVTVKVTSYDEADTSDKYYEEALSILDLMGIEKASHFLLWTLMNSNQFHNAVSEGKLYDAALRLKKEGRIKYIGASLHMQYDDICEVIDSGLFEFLLVSCNLLNLWDMQPILDKALEKNVDILIMNPLFGGLIAENEKLFEYAKISEEETVVQAAVRALLSHPAVKCVLAGASSEKQLDGYLSAITDEFLAEDKSLRLDAIRKHQTGNSVFCTYCRYCADCPKGIPVPQIMNSRNMLTLNEGKDSAAGSFFKLLHEKFELRFENSENPCIRCGKCERRCTQHLPIMDSIAESYRIISETCYDMDSRRKRFDSLLHGCKKVGFWPASAGTKKIIDLYSDIMGGIPFEVCLFDSNPEFNGTTRFGYPVYDKQNAEKSGVECILITSFLHGNAIYEQIKDLESKGIGIKTLYRKGDVDWWW